MRASWRSSIPALPGGGRIPPAPGRNARNRRGSAGAVLIAAATRREADRRCRRRYRSSPEGLPRGDHGAPPRSSATGPGQEWRTMTRTFRSGRSPSGHQAERRAGGMMLRSWNSSKMTDPHRRARSDWEARVRIPSVHTSIRVRRALAVDRIAYPTVPPTSSPIDCASTARPRPRRSFSVRA